MAYGLVPVRYKSGAPYNGACNRYFVGSGDSTALFIGDPVIISGTGDAAGIPGVTRAAAGDRITGVVVGIGANSGTLSAATTPGVALGYRAASVDSYVLVADDPALLFEAQEDAVGGALATGDIGNNVDLIAAAGSTVTKQSGYLLDSSTKATTTAQVRLWGLSPRVNNDFGAATTAWLVSIVEATETPAAGTTGV